MCSCAIIEVIAICQQKVLPKKATNTMISVYTPYVKCIGCLKGLTLHKQEVATCLFPGLGISPESCGNLAISASVHIKSAS